MKSKFLKSIAATGLMASASVFGSVSNAQAADLTLCWAAWDPANALVELSKEFEAQSGHNMSFEFVPWPNFADRMLNELNSGGKLCDLLIGDSQWIGGAAENGQYVKLNDFFDKEGISMGDFLPATVTGYAEWPKNTPNYYALPAYADVVGWTYRKDWFERPEIAAEFKGKYGRDLDAPANLEELQQIGEFFQGREIDGKTVYGAAIYTERGSEGITMGVTNALYNYGFLYEDPKNPYELDGFVNSDAAAAGLEYYKKLSAFSEIKWSGISQNISTLEKYGIPHTESLKVLHAINEDNQMVYGVDTFILIWQQLPKWKWLAKFVGLPLIYQLSKGIYSIFAMWRFKNLDHCTIE